MAARGQSAPKRVGTVQAQHRHFNHRPPGFSADCRLCRESTRCINEACVSSGRAQRRTQLPWQAVNMAAAENTTEQAGSGCTLQGVAGRHAWQLSRHSTLQHISRQACQTAAATALQLKMPHIRTSGAKQGEPGKQVQRFPLIQTDLQCKVQARQRRDIKRPGSSGPQRSPCLHHRRDQWPVGSRQRRRNDAGLQRCWQGTRIGAAAAARPAAEAACKAAAVSLQGAGAPAAAVAAAAASEAPLAG